MSSKRPAQHPRRIPRIILAIAIACVMCGSWLIFSSYSNNSDDLAKGIVFFIGGGLAILLALRSLNRQSRPNGNGAT